jgi:hypothetical protein
MQSNTFELKGKPLSLGAEMLGVIIAVGALVLKATVSPARFFQNAAGRRRSRKTASAGGRCSWKNTAARLCTENIRATPASTRRNSCPRLKEWWRTP